MSVLALEEVEAGYGETPVLRGVSLRVDPGETVAVIGPNGAGKSTAMKAVFGMVKVARGRVRLEGRDNRQRGAGADGAARRVLRAAGGTTCSRR